jgi:hypothetical protein
MKNSRFKNVMIAVQVVLLLLFCGTAAMEAFSGQWGDFALSLVGIVLAGTVLRLVWTLDDSAVTIRASLHISKDDEK